MGIFFYYVDIVLDIASFYTSDRDGLLIKMTNLPGNLRSDFFFKFSKYDCYFFYVVLQTLIVSMSFSFTRI